MSKNKPAAVIRDRRVARIKGGVNRCIVLLPWSPSLGLAGLPHYIVHCACRRGEPPVFLPRGYLGALQ